jgi:hypothetical protein
MPIRLNTPVTRLMGHSHSCWIKGRLARVKMTHTAKKA